MSSVKLAILFRPQCVHCSDAATRIYQVQCVNTIEADALAPYLARTSAAMILTTQFKWALSFVKMGLNYLLTLNVDK